MECIKSDSKGLKLHLGNMRIKHEQYWSAETLRDQDDILKLEIILKPISSTVKKWLWWKVTLIYFWMLFMIILWAMHGSELVGGRCFALPILWSLVWVAADMRDKSKKALGYRFLARAGFTPTLARRQPLEHITASPSTVTIRAPALNILLYRKVFFASLRVVY